MIALNQNGMMLIVAFLILAASETLVGMAMSVIVFCFD